MLEYSALDLLTKKVTASPNEVVDTVCKAYGVSREEIKLQGIPYNEQTPAAKALHCISGILFYYHDIDQETIGAIIGTNGSKIRRSVDSQLSYEEMQTAALNLANNRPALFYQTDPRDLEALSEERESRTDYQKRLTKIETYEAVRDIVGTVYKSGVHIDASDNFINQVCAIANDLFEFRKPIKVDDVKADKRDKPFDIVRKSLYYLLVEAGASKKATGEALCRKDHTTVIHGYREIVKKIGHIEKPKKQYRKVTSFIHNLPEEDREFLESVRVAYETNSSELTDNLLECYWKFPFESHDPNTFLLEVCGVASYITGQEIETSDMRNTMSGSNRSKRTMIALDTYNFAVFMLREMFGMELRKIADLLNKKDHTTILHSYRKASDIIGAKVDERRKQVSEEDIKKFALHHIESSYLGTYSPEELIDYVCNLVNMVSGRKITSEDIVSQSKRSDKILGIARRFVYYVFKDKTKLTAREIEKVLNRTDSTIRWGQNIVLDYKRSLETSVQIEEKPKDKEVSPKPIEETSIKYRYTLPQLDIINPFSTVRDLHETLQKYVKEYRTIIGQAERTTVTKEKFASDVNDIIEELTQLFSWRVMMTHESETIVSIDGKETKVGSEELFEEDNGRFLRERDEFLYPLLRKLETLVI